MVQNLPEVQLPLYQVHCYGDFLYRVTKRLCSPHPGIRVPREEWQENSGKLENALIRAKTTVREYCLCNRWEYFVTLTINGSEHDRYDLQGFLKEFLQWMQNLKRTTCPRLRYVLVPEQHKHEDPISGRAWHFHGLISGIDIGSQLPGTPKSIRDECPDCWPLYSARYGFSTASAIKDPVACGMYVSKYISKSTADMVSLKGVHTYYHSRGLNKSLRVGALYTPSVTLDKLCKYQNPYYAVGFFQAKSVGDVINYLDRDGGEIDVAYHSWVFYDPVDKSIAGVLGGDDEDEFVQEQLSLFLSQGYSVCTDGLPDDL